MDVADYCIRKFWEIDYLVPDSIIVEHTERIYDENEGVTIPVASWSNRSGILLAMVRVPPVCRLYVFSANSGLAWRNVIWVSVSCIERYGKVKMP